MYKKTKIDDNPLTATLAHVSYNVFRNTKTQMVQGMSF